MVQYDVNQYEVENYIHNHLLFYYKYIHLLFHYYNSFEFHRYKNIDIDNVDIEIHDVYDQIIVLLLYKQEHDHRTIQEILLDHIIKYNLDRDQYHLNSSQD